jgi:hypothetical protein
MKDFKNYEKKKEWRENKSTSCKGNAR